MPTYNALRYTQSLEDAGFTRPQAEAAVKLVLETMDDLFATKADLKESQFQLRQDFQALRSEFQELRQEVRYEIRELESRMTIKLGGLMIAGIAVMQFLQK
jgi:hypothetical protein